MCVFYDCSTLGAWNLGPLYYNAAQQNVLLHEKWSVVAHYLSLFL